MTQRAIAATVPAPTGGLNAREPLANMPPGDASVLTNMFADTTAVTTRKGHEAFADGTALFNTAFNTTRGFRDLAVWQSGGSSKLFAALLGATAAPATRWGLYEVSTGGSLTLSHTVNGTGLADEPAAVGESTMFVTGSSTPYLVWRFQDGVGPYIAAYDGSAWSTPSITGLPTSGVGIASHQRRLWFYGKDLTAYYLPANAIAGAASAFNLGPYFSKGGRIVALRTWTMDGGDGGSDDLAVFLTDSGQAAVFAGNDPSARATWQLVGVFNVGRVASPALTTLPINRSNAFAMKYGADLLFLLSDGVMSAAKVLRPSLGEQDYSLSSKIDALIRDATAVYGQDGTAPVESWCIVHHPKLKQLLVNISTVAAANNAAGRAESIQYVMNTETGSWQKFESMGMSVGVIWRGDLYFVANGYYVYRYGTTNNDLGNNITYECRQAYNYFQNPNNKLATIIQPMLRATATFSMTLQADADFNPGTISTFGYTTYTLGAEANVQPILSPAKYGRAFAAHIQGTTSSGSLTWYATNWTMQPTVGISL